MARIYNQGIEDRVATFETRLRSAGDVEKWFDGVHPMSAIEDGGEVVAFASTSLYRPRDCYAGIAECSVYVEREWRRRGAGRMCVDRAARGGAGIAGVSGECRDRREVAVMERTLGTSAVMLFARYRTPAIARGCVKTPLWPLSP